MKQILFFGILTFTVACGKGVESPVDGKLNTTNKMPFFAVGDYAEFSWSGTKVNGTYMREVTAHNATAKNYQFVEKWVGTNGGQAYRVNVPSQFPTSYLENDRKELKEILDGCIADNRIESLSTNLGAIEACKYELPVTSGIKITRWFGNVPLTIVKERLVHPDGSFEEKLIKKARYGN